MAETTPDMAMITELLSKLGPNASMADIAKLVPKDPAKLGPLVEQFESLQKPAPNLDTFDYSSLAPGKGVLKRAIAAPMVPLKPALPWQLCVSLKLKPQFSDPAITSFLSTLPKPFHWRFETEEERDNLADGIEVKNQEESRKSYEIAEKKRAEGNAAFAKKEAATAIQAYSDAIEAGLDALAQNTDETEGSTKEMLAICYANRSAAYLLPGVGNDTVKALEDGEEAERHNPAYAKAYFRQATAHEALKDLRKAKLCMERGLRVPELRNNVVMKERLTELDNAGA